MRARKNLLAATGRIECATAGGAVTRQNNSIVDMSHLNHQQHHQRQQQHQHQHQSPELPVPLQRPSARPTPQLHRCVDDVLTKTVVLTCRGDSSDMSAVPELPVPLARPMHRPPPPTSHNSPPPPPPPPLHQQRRRQPCLFVCVCVLLAVVHSCVCLSVVERRCWRSAARDG
jgi:hypothetical protein